MALYKRSSINPSINQSIHQSINHCYRGVSDAVPWPTPFIAGGACVPRHTDARAVVRRAGGGMLASAHLKAASSVESFVTAVLTSAMITVVTGP